MKSQIEIPDKELEPSFPCLMKMVTNDPLEVVVLFEASEYGTVVHTTSPIRYPLGRNTKWNMNVFKTFNGVIRLANN
jgi:hypothetical protein